MLICEAVLSEAQMAKTSLKSGGNNHSEGPPARQGQKDGQSAKGHVLAALRRSPLAGADLDLTREVVEPRKVDL